MQPYVHAFDLNITIISSATHTHIQDISLRIVDLLTMDRHATKNGDAALTIDRIFADRTRLEQVAVSTCRCENKRRKAIKKHSFCKGYCLVVQLVEWPMHFSCW